MFLLGCSWDSGRDLVGPRGHARHPSWQRRRAAAADSTSALERDAGSAEWQETGGCRSCSSRNMTYWRILANRRFRATIAYFRSGPADPNGLDDLKFRFLGQILRASPPLRMSKSIPLEVSIVGVAYCLHRQATELGCRVSTEYCTTLTS
jgi:hypothetical protein